MKTRDFSTTILFDHSQKEVFDAINNVRGWWSEEIKGYTDRLHAEWSYRFQDDHQCRMKIVEFVPNRRVVWLVMDNFFSFTRDKSEWIGNKIIFDITVRADKTQLQFTQIGLVPEYECYDVCQGAWEMYIQKSLRNLITTGTGQPNAKEEPRPEDEVNLAAGFTVIFVVKKTPAEVFASINNVAAWWQGEIKGNSENVNDEFEYRMPDIHYSKQKVVESIPGKKVVWLVTDSNLSTFGDKQEWNGTKIIFEIREIGDKTQVKFTHLGLVQRFQCYGDCTGAWDALIRQSLFSLITMGKGKKVF